MIWFYLLLSFLCCGYADTVARAYTSSLCLHDREIMAVTATTEFEEELYVYVGCGGGNTERVSFRPCTTRLCIDSSYKTFELNNTTTILGRIANYDNCSAAFVVAISSIFGNPTVTLMIGNFYTVLVNDYRMFPFKMCCKDLRMAAGNSWSGYFYISIEVTENSRVQIMLPSRPLLSLEDFFSFVPVSLNCPSMADECENCDFNVRSTRDPFISFYRRLVLDKIGEREDPELVTKNAISTIFSIYEKATGDMVYKMSGGYGTRVLSKENELSRLCTITYKGLADKRGITHDLTVPVTSAEQYCDYTEFSEKATKFDGLLEKLTAHDFVPHRTKTISYLDLAGVYTSSVVWVRCRALLYSFMDVRVTEQVFLESVCTSSPGTEKWMEDPCCNTELSSYMCCHETSVTRPILSYSLTDEGKALTNATCSGNTCIPLLVAHFASLLETSHCDDLSKQATSDPKFLAYNTFEQCRARVYETPCSLDVSCADLPYSVCDSASGRCTVPCSSHSDCPTQLCMQAKAWSEEKICIGTSQDKVKDVITCFLNNIDPYLDILIRDEINSSDSRDIPFYEKFADRVTVGACVEPTLNLPWIQAASTEEECMNSVKWCPWLACAIPNQCSEEDCLNPFPSSYMCGSGASPYFFAGFFTPDVCEVRITETGEVKEMTHKNSALCLELDPTNIFVGFTETAIQYYGPCLHPSANTSTLCYSSDYCIPGYMNVECSSYCYMSSYGRHECEDLNYLWITWETQEGTSQATCIIPEISYRECLNLEASWFQGYKFIPRWNFSEEECDGLCRNSVAIYPDIKRQECEEASCSSCFTGLEESCLSKEHCTQSLICNNPQGCLFSEAPFFPNVNSLCRYHPGGKCLHSGFREDTCKQLDPSREGTFLYTLRTKEECENHAFICRMKGTPVNRTSQGSVTIPEGFSEYSKEECEACGGTYEPFFTWTNATWGHQKMWTSLQWTEKKILSPVWRETLSSDLFMELLEASRALRLASILTQEIYCKYSAERQTIAQVACSCGQSTSNISECSEKGVKGLVISSVSLCQGIYQLSHKWTRNTFLEFYLPENFTESSNICAQVNLVIISESQFLDVIREPVSSLDIVSASKKLEMNRQYVFNSRSPQVVVGRILGDGIGFTFSDAVGFTVCIEFPTIDLSQWTLYQPPAQLNVVISDLTDYDKWTIFGEWPLDATRACVVVNHSHISIFPAATIANWETVEIQDCWPPEELRFILVLAGLYLLLLIFLTVSAVFRWQHAMKPFYEDFPRIALVFIIALCILRVIYFSGLVFGTYEVNYGVVIIFADLPALLFFNSVLLTGIIWAAVYMLTFEVELTDRTPAEKIKTLLKVTSACTGLLYIIFIVLFALYARYLLETAIPFCGTPEQEDDTMNTTVYKRVIHSIFAIYAITVAIFFAYYSVKLLLAMQQNERSRQLRKWVKFMLVSVICFLALILQAILLLVALDHEFHNFSKCWIVLCTEFLPACFLAVLLRYKSHFNDNTSNTPRTCHTRTRAQPEAMVKQAV
eukprot:TRINITY_DN7359_c0_g1_i1.p1 TRINITY_DN7359_c0_g1~~TRINITY_DN7359_c0_g1_i1.p1  ORF type:complete len:1520 (+),score=180.70 TRINITY_DN7359_c0_g1_i1:47-4606(+)